jgi:hypothetical protein
MTNAKNTSLWTNEGKAPTPGAAAPPVTLPMDNTSTAGLTVTFGTPSPTGLPALRVTTSSGAPVFNVFPFSVRADGSRVGVIATFGAGETSIDGTQSIPPLTLQDGTGTGGSAAIAQMWSGTGAPGASTVGTAAVGDIYLRRDGGGAANVNVYICTVAGSPGTWVGFA